MQLTNKPVVALLAVAVSATIAGCNSASAPAASGPGHRGAATVQQTPAKPKPTCPLTGQVRTKSERVKRAPLAVKIDNVVGALPQSGVNRADVVVEELVEGGLTRLMAIYQCSSAPVVGPIRSARISDADILALLHGSVLGYSGANPADIPPIVHDADTVLVSQDANPQFFYRGTAHLAPHNVYSSTEKILKAGLAKRPHLSAPKPLFTYGAIDPSARTAKSISISWPAASAVWTWSKNAWLRTQNGSVDRESDGQQLSATNVVIMRVAIASTGLRDVLGNASPRDVTVGRNPLWVLRDGKMIKGTWSRKSITAPLVLHDTAGKVIRLAPGRTWIELLPGPSVPHRG